jgi:probable F420-dependent oxidoreductase
VDFGIHIGTRGCLTNRENMMRVARDAEADGYAIVGIPDHLLMPAEPEGTYPYTATGLHPAAQSGECFDLLATLAFLAGCTEKIRLLTSVVVTPHRPPILTAKLFQTVDVLSGGRLIAGAGAGWMKAEFDALRTEPFEERGAVTDEYIEAWKILWTQARPSMHGKYVQFDNIMFEPKPVQKPHPPVWIGGESNPSLRRAARLGEGWYPASNNSRFPMNTPARMKTGVERMHRELEKQGRDPASLDIAYIFFAPPTWKPRNLPDGERQMFSGSSDAMLEDAAALKAVGVSHLIVYLQRPTIEQTLDVLHRFGEEVVRKHHD